MTAPEMEQAREVLGWLEAEGLTLSIEGDYLAAEPADRIKIKHARLIRLYTAPLIRLLKQPRKITDGQLYAARALWELDPRPGFAWLALEPWIPVTHTALRYWARKQKWKKRVKRVRIRL